VTKKCINIIGIFAGSVTNSLVIALVRKYFVVIIIFGFGNFGLEDSADETK